MGGRPAERSGRSRRVGPPDTFGRVDFPAGREARRAVFGVLEHYAPVIEPLALDEAYLDLTGQEALMGPPSAVAQRLRDEVKRGCGLDISIGVASCKLVAKVASDLRKPRGLVVVPRSGGRWPLRGIHSSLPGIR